MRILEDKSGVVLHGLEEVHVKTASDIFQLLDQGSAKRRTAETLLNKQSSRSHSVFTVTVSIRCGLLRVRGGELMCTGKGGRERGSAWTGESVVAWCVRGATAGMSVVVNRVGG